jgi:hypothetical protein
MTPPMTPHDCPRFAIEDPLELEHDTARMLTVASMARVRREFTRADQILSTATDGEGGVDASSGAAGSAPAAAGCQGGGSFDAAVALLLRTCADEPVPRRGTTAVEACDGADDADDADDADCASASADGEADGSALLDEADQVLDLDADEDFAGST